MPDTVENDDDLGFPLAQTDPDDLRARVIDNSEVVLTGTVQTWHEPAPQ